MQKYYLTQNGKPVGPWSVQEILSELKAQTINWTDYLYDESRKDWVLLLDHVDLVPYFKDSSNKGGSPFPQHQLRSEVKNIRSEGSEAVPKQEWFALRGENKYGPFAYLELVKMLQSKKLFEFDYVWNASFAGWKRIAECDEFRPEKVKALMQSGGPELSEVFFRRRHARANYGSSIVVHNNKQVWYGESLEISSGGCGLLLGNQHLEPGQTLFLHFKVGDGVPPFNATCEVVSKQPAKTGNGYCKYGVKFTHINRQVQLAIRDFALSGPKAA